MVNAGGNASSWHYLRTVPPQQQRMEILMGTAYPPPRFVQRCPPQLTRRLQVVNCIKRRVMCVSECLLLGNHRLTNRRALGHTIVRSVFQVAYTESRRDIFLPPPQPGDSGTISYADTIAGIVIAHVAGSADPLIFTSLLSCFLAYGVDFAQPRHDHQSAGSSENGIWTSPSLASLDSALWCLHALALDIFGRIIIQLHRLEEKRGGKEYEKDLSTLLHLLPNGHALLSLLWFFAEERPDAADADPNDSSAPSVDGATLTDVTTSGDAPVPYTTTSFHSLFRWKHFNSISIAEAMNRIFATAGHVLSDVGLKWSLNDEENIATVFANYFECYSGLGLGLRLAAQYCRDFPVLYEAVKECGGNTFKFSQLVHSKVVCLPARSQKDAERERSVFYTPDAARQKNEPGKREMADDTVPICANSSNTNGDTVVSHAMLPGKQQHHYAAEMKAEIELTSSCSAFIGLYNVGNTCFINSFMQLLFAAKHFRMELVREALLYLVDMDKKGCPEPGVADDISDSGIDSSQCSLTSKKVAIASALLLAQMQWRLRHGYGAIAIDTVLLRGVLPEPLNDGCQHDASEYAKVVLEHLDYFSGSIGACDEPEDLQQQQQQQRQSGQEVSLSAHPVASTSSDNDAMATVKSVWGSQKKRVTVVARWFGGFCASLLECQRCHCMRTKLSPFWDISVPLRREGGDGVHANADMIVLRPEVAVVESEELAHVTDIVKSEDGHVAVTKYYTSADDDYGAEVSDDSVDEGRSNKHKQRRTSKEDETTKGAMFYGPRQQNFVCASSSISLQQLVDRVLNYRDLFEILQGDNAAYCESCCSREPALLRVAMHATCSPGAAVCVADDEKEEEDEQEGRRRHHERELLVNEEDIEGVPFYLTLQLNRFQYTRESGQYEKLMDPVRLNEYLNVPVRVVAGQSRPEVFNEDDVNSNGYNDDDDDGGGGSCTVIHKSVRYRLIAVLVHSGPTPRSGHYFSLLRLPSDVEAAADMGAGIASAGTGSHTCGSWVLANDSVVSPLTAATVEAVLSGTGGVFSHLETPYIILYERCCNICHPAPEENILFPRKIEEFFQMLLRESMATARTSAAVPAFTGGGGDDEEDDDDGNRKSFGTGASSWGGGGPIY